MSDTTPWFPSRSDIDRLTLIGIETAFISTWANGNNPIEDLPLHIQEFLR